MEPMDQTDDSRVTISSEEWVRLQQRAQQLSAPATSRPWSSSTGSSTVPMATDGHPQPQSSATKAHHQGISQAQLNRQLDALIMDYLVVGGFKDAAAKFADEAQVQTRTNLAAVDARMQVRRLVQAGNVQEAISRTNDLVPEALESNTQTLLRLRILQLVELVRNGDTEAALKFSQDELALAAADHPEHLDEVEDAMLLLLFGPQDQDSPVASLLDSAHRARVAGELNSAILKAQAQDELPRLPMLLTLLDWCQSRLEKMADFPKLDLNSK